MTINCEFLRFASGGKWDADLEKIEHKERPNARYEPKNRIRFGAMENQRKKK